MNLGADLFSLSDPRAHKYAKALPKAASWKMADELLVAVLRVSPTQVRYTELCDRLLAAGDACGIFPPGTATTGAGGRRVAVSSKSDRMRRVALAVRHLDVLQPGGGSPPPPGQAGGSADLPRKRRLIPCAEQAVASLLRPTSKDDDSSKRPRGPTTATAASGRRDEARTSARSESEIGRVNVGTPPSRVAVDAARGARQARLRRVKAAMAGGLERLGLLNNSSSPHDEGGSDAAGGCDWEDGVMANMLLAGHPEEHILQGWYTRHGAAVPDSLQPGSAGGGPDPPISDAEVATYLLHGVEAEARQAMAAACPAATSDGQQ
eukprot:jgi/Tetstr1/430476/TSEL_020284.t1